MSRLAATADLLATSAPVASSGARWLTSRTNVKAAMGITSTDSDALIDLLIPQASALIVGGCGLAVDKAGSIASFGLETLVATYRERGLDRGEVLTLPWRVPVAGITSLTEDGTTLAAGTDFELVSTKPGKLRRLTDSSPTWWSSAAIVVTFTAGWSLPGNVPPDMEAAAIEQVRAMVHAAKRDPAVRSENVPDFAAVSYSLPGGDTFKGVLLPQVTAALAAAGYLNPMAI